MSELSFLLVYGSRLFSKVSQERRTEHVTGCDRDVSGEKGTEIYKNHRGGDFYGL